VSPISSIGYRPHDDDAEDVKFKYAEIVISIILMKIVFLLVTILVFVVKLHRRQTDIRTSLGDSEGMNPLLAERYTAVW
jgi:uncharacterized membrane protein